MMYSVTDVAGINNISARVLGNAAHAVAGMVKFELPEQQHVKPAIGMTMFGVTTPCVDAVRAQLEEHYECLVFHATGTGGQSMEKLLDSGMLAGVIDISTTEVCDLHMGGVMSAGEDRLGAVIRSRRPYVGSVGALDMVNFGAMDTVPEKYQGRNLYVHNPQVTLMRTTAEENRRMGDPLAHQRDLLTTPYVFSAEDARKMTEAGADIIVAHMGLTTKGSIGARTAKTLDDSVKLIQEWAAAAREVREDVIVLCHGGPIAMPEDARYVLERTKGINGFYGASSMERLPTERAIKAQIEEFKKLSF